jgi:hypothetical protein
MTRDIHALLGGAYVCHLCFMLVIASCLVGCGLPLELAAGSLDDARVVDGPAWVSRFDQPIAMASDSKGNLYITEASGRIRKLSPDQQVSTFAGNGSKPQKEVPKGTKRKLNEALQPQNIFIRDDVLYFTELECVNTIDLKVPESEREVSTIWGTCMPYDTPRHELASDPEITIYHPHKLVVTKDHQFIYAVMQLDLAGRFIYRVNISSSELQEVAGISQGFSDFEGLVIDSEDNVYFTSPPPIPGPPPVFGSSLPMEPTLFKLGGAQVMTSERMVISDLNGYISSLSVGFDDGLYMINVSDKKLKKINLKNKKTKDISDLRHEFPAKNSRYYGYSIWMNDATQELFILIDNALYKWAIHSSLN